MMNPPLHNIQKRSEEITREYFTLLDKHIADIVGGRVTEMMGLRQIASELCISHQHLTDTIQKTMGRHPCYYYDLKIIQQAESMLDKTDLSIAEIARTLTYDPSNFSKFFRKFTGQTPGSFRQNSKK